MFSSDVLQLFCGPISQEKNRRQKRPIAPARVVRERCTGLYLARNDLNAEWLRSWKMEVPEGFPYKGGLQFAQKQKRGLLI